MSLLENLEDDRRLRLFAPWKTLENSSTKNAICHYQDLYQALIAKEMERRKSWESKSTPRPKCRPPLK